VSLTAARVQEHCEVAIVGGGPAGAALAIRLAGAGADVALFERQPEPRWRACGVYSTAALRGRLAGLGLAPSTLGRLIRPIRTMQLRTTQGGACDLEHPPPFACGVDRGPLERTLLDAAVAAGARVHEGAVVTRVVDRQVTVTGATGPATWSARLVAGADGSRSMVARAAGLDRPTRHFRRAGITAHHHDPEAPEEGRPGVAMLCVGPGWYCGVAPVPGARVNVGLVVGERTLRAWASSGRSPGEWVDAVVRRLPGEPPSWRGAPRTDRVVVALPLAYRPLRLVGPAHLLVGDAAGFVDPITGEGLHRALVSADLAADAILAWRTGRSWALADYERSMRARFRGKDALSWLLQLFLARPAVATYALDRMARRPRLAETFGSALADRAPASRALDPRFLAAMLAP
jgi:flavin-dependent dehydrogenase